MLSADKIIESLVEKLDLPDEAALARLFGKSHNLMTLWKERGKVNVGRVVTFCEQHGLDIREVLQDVPPKNQGIQDAGGWQQGANALINDSARLAEIIVKKHVMILEHAGDAVDYEDAMKPAEKQNEMPDQDVPRGQ